MKNNLLLTSLDIDETLLAQAAAPGGPTEPR
jgi:hypothetical protein